MNRDWKLPHEIFELQIEWIQIHSWNLENLTLNVQHCVLDSLRILAPVATKLYSSYAQNSFALQFNIYINIVHVFSSFSFELHDATFQSKLLTGASKFEQTPSVCIHTNYHKIPIVIYVAFLSRAT